MGSNTHGSQKLLISGACVHTQGTDPGAPGRQAAQDQGKGHTAFYHSVVGSGHITQSGPPFPHLCRQWEPVPEAFRPASASPSPPAADG